MLLANPFGDLGQEHMISLGNPVDQNREPRIARPALLRSIAAGQHPHRSLGGQHLLRAATGQRRDLVGAMAASGYWLADRANANASDQQRCSAWHNRLVTSGGLERVPPRTIGLYDHMIYKPEPSVTLLGRYAERTMIVHGRPDQRDRIFRRLSERRRQLVISWIDKQRKPIGTISAHLGGGGKNPTPRQLTAQGEQCGGLPAPADQRNQFVPTGPQSLTDPADSYHLGHCATVLLAPREPDSLPESVTLPFS